MSSTFKTFLVVVVAVFTATTFSYSYAQDEASSKFEVFKENVPEELKDAENLSTVQFLEIVRELSQFEVESYLKVKLLSGDPNPDENFFVKNPIFISYFARLIRDQEAIPSLVKMFDYPVKWVIFAVIFFGLFFVSRFFMYYYNRNVLALKAIGRCVVRVFTMWSLRLIAFCYLFYAQLAPFGRIFREFLIDLIRA